jgi:thioesterase domain-containing protein
VIHPETLYDPLVAIQTGRKGICPLFCIPGAGANVSSFVGLAAVLDGDLPIYGLQPQGWDGVLPPYTDIAAMARSYVQAIYKEFPQGPYQLMGHSFGGWVAFEMAKQLIADGKQVATLIVVDSRAPFDVTQERKFYTRIEIMLKLAGIYEDISGRSITLAESDLAPISHEQQIKLLLDRLVEANILPRNTTIHALRGIVQVYEANMNTHYQPQDIYRGSLHFVAAEEVTPRIRADIGNTELFDKWRRFAPNSVLLETPGNHFSLLKSPHVMHLAKLLQPLLDRS